jgi:hypothetical protein
MRTRPPVTAAVAMMAALSPSTPAFAAPSFAAPSFAAPSFSAPSFGASSFGALSAVTPSFASPRAADRLRRAALAITTPASASLGSAAPGGTVSAQLGTVMVDDTRILLANWTSTATTTTFITGAGAPAQTIAKSRVSYWSGPVTASAGLGVRTPGQLTAANAVPLTNPVTAFGLQAIVLGTSTSWNPTVVVSLPAAAVAGTYTGTVTHSVA